MSIFKVTFNNVWQQLTPPVLRQTAQNAWGSTLTQPLQINNVLFLEYITGSTSYGSFASGTTYSAGTRIIYTDKIVYENLTGSTGPYPTDSNTWLQVNSNYIGAKERASYSAQKLTYEFALNRWFQVTGFFPSYSFSAITQDLFAQSANTIYISNNNTSTTAFIMGQTGPFSSIMVASSVYASSFMVNNYTAATMYDYTIWVPNSLNISQSLVYNFANTINMAGMNFSVSGY